MRLLIANLRYGRRTLQGLNPCTMFYARVQYSGGSVPKPTPIVRYFEIRKPKTETTAKHGKIPNIDTDVQKTDTDSALASIYNAPMRLRLVVSNNFIVQGFENTHTYIEVTVGQFIINSYFRDYTVFHSLCLLTRCTSLCALLIIAMIDPKLMASLEQQDDDEVAAGKRMLIA
jgi:hypothetical protein